MVTKETIVTDSPKVSCDGGKGSLGHPLIYLDMTGKNEITCPYCSKHFILQTSKKAKKIEH